MKGEKTRYTGLQLLHKLADLPQETVHWLKNKTQTAIYEKKLLESAHRIELDAVWTETLRKRLRFTLALTGTGAAPRPSAADSALVARIARERDVHNANNISRTAAYYHLFREHPELHWALLAHMVSRNGGWNMSDLKGELLPHLLNEPDRESIFRFLERANALIFHDAYPQLLLYRASVLAGRPYFHLLPCFGVSRFMKPVWELFWRGRSSPLLTIGLIVNEQHFIEQRVVRHPVYRKQVLDRLFFQAQSLLQLNQIVFPYVDRDRVRVAGLIIENFTSLRERIEIGKKLYAVLFGIPVVTEGAKQFAAGRKHTGTRADYWPHLFASIRRDAPAPPGQLTEKLNGCQLRPGAAPLYSPKLEDVWGTRPVEPPEGIDWFTDLGVTDYFEAIRAPFSFEMTHEHGFGWNKIEMAVLAGDVLK